MGLFSDLFGSSSHTQTTQSTSNVTNTQLAGGSIDAPVAYGTGNRQNVTINSVDPGSAATVQLVGGMSLAAASDIAARSLATGATVGALGLAAGAQLATDISGAAVSLGQSAMKSNAAVTNSALDFGTRAIGAATQSTDAISRFAGSALDTNAALAGVAIHDVSASGLNALDFASNVLTDSIHAQANLTQANLAGVTGLAAQVSQSATQSVNDSLQKIVLYIALAYAAAMIFRGGLK